MAFSGAFVKTFRPAFDAGLAAAAVPWYLAGGAPTPIAVYQPKGAADLAASYVNLVTPGTYNAAPGTAPTFNVATGWAFNGSSQYLVSSLDIHAPPFSVIIRFTPSTITGYRGLIGANASGAGYVEFQTVTTTGKLQLVKSNTAAVGASNTSAAPSQPCIGGVTYDSSGKWAWYFNGLADGSGTNLQTFGAAGIAIGVQRTTLPVEWYSGIISAIAIYNTALTPSQATAVSAAMAAF